MDRRWLWINLDPLKADAYKVFLKAHRIKFETSGYGNLIHFECHVSWDEYDACDEFLKTL